MADELAFGFRNILETGRIGLLFLMPGVRETRRAGKPTAHPP